jgi:hypothetical protein
MLGNNTTPGNATNFLEYENSTYGIKMHYPSDWQSVGGASNSSIVASFNPLVYYSRDVRATLDTVWNVISDIDREPENLSSGMVQSL